MLETLARWNRWGTAELPGRIPRDVAERLVPFLDSPEAVALIGPRRAGKTTVLFQVMDRLVDRGVPVQAMLHVNFEEPAFMPDLGLALLDRIVETWRAHVWPTGRAWLFFDEIQHVPGWERWVRARSELEGAKVFLTGSSSALMSRELGTLLTGRHVRFEVRPLDLTERLRFANKVPPARPDLIAPPPEILAALSDARRWGGFPEVVLSQDERRRAALLKQYFDDVLFKDVTMRHEVRDVRTLRSLAVHLLTQTASLVSLQRVARVLGVSVDLGKAYCSFLEEAFLVDFLDFHTLKTAERLRRPRKVHAVDMGLRNAVCISGSADRGRLAESMVLSGLRREEPDAIGWWKGNGEVDFVVRQGNAVTELVQVTSTDDGTLAPREVAALREARGHFPGARSVLVVDAAPGTKPPTAIDGIDVVPLWRFLLARGATPPPMEW